MITWVVVKQYLEECIARERSKYRKAESYAEVKEIAGREEAFLELLQLPAILEAREDARGV